MLALPKPYGYPAGLAISIRAPRERYFEIGEVCGDYGCPDFVVSRVRDSIRGSGRYDCFVGWTVAVAVDDLQRDLAMIGSTLTVVPMPSHEYKLYQELHPKEPVVPCGCVLCENDTEFFKEESSVILLIV